MQGSGQTYHTVCKCYGNSCFFLHLLSVKAWGSITFVASFTQLLSAFGSYLRCTVSSYCSSLTPTYTRNHLLHNACLLWHFLTYWHRHSQQAQWWYWQEWRMSLGLVSLCLMLRSHIVLPSPCAILLRLYINERRSGSSLWLSCCHSPRKLGPAIVWSPYTLVR